MMQVNNVLDHSNYAKLSAVNNRKVIEIVEYYIDLCKPSKVTVISDSEEDTNYIRELSLKLGEESPLAITTIPVSVTMGKIGNHIIVDPNGDEWDSMDARVTITSDSDGNIVALQKGGNEGFTLEEMHQCGEISVRVGAKIREVIKAAQKGSQ